MLNIVNVFVYGTLKPGEANYQKYCADKVLTVQSAIAHGELFALPFNYPAMTLGNSIVQGFLLSFPSSAQLTTSVLNELDWLEGYDPYSEDQNNEYNRQSIATYNLNFAPLTTAWAYLMTPEQVQACGGVCLPDGWWSGCGLAPS